jgi:hypothetical protein
MKVHQANYVGQLQAITLDCMFLALGHIGLLHRIVNAANSRDSDCHLSHKKYHQEPIVLDDFKSARFQKYELRARAFPIQD